MIKTTMYLSNEQMAELEATARREDRAKVEVVRDALQRYFNGHGKVVPQSRGIIEDHEVNSTNIDDWLRENWHPE